MCWTSDYESSTTATSGSLIERQSRKSKKARQCLYETSGSTGLASGALEIVPENNLAFIITTCIYYSRLGPVDLPAPYHIF